MKRLLRALLERVVRLYYPAIVLDDATRIPAGACVIVLNHPNGLLDPALLRVALGRDVRFLAKSTLFGNFAGRFLMDAFGAIPVYRAKETAAAGADRNDRTFALCRAALARGECVALFPEGTSHSDPSMKPLKTGAARIALSAEREQHAGLRIVPVGLHYEEKSVFGSRAVLAAGEPIEVAPFAAAEDERDAVDRLTVEVRRALDAVVLQADTRALLEGIARVAALTAADASIRDDPAAARRRSRALLAAWEGLRASDPARAEALVEAGRRYLAAVEGAGIADPWALETDRITRGAVARTSLRLVAGAPFAVVGALLGWPAYRAAGVLARRVAAEEDVLGTVKLFAGTALVPLGWAIAAAVAYHFAGWRGAVAVAAGGPAGGYLALRWEQWAADAIEAIRMAWMRARHPEVVATLAARRRSLSDAIATAVRELPEDLSRPDRAASSPAPR